MNLVSAATLLRQSLKDSSYIVSFSAALDKILGGGFSLGDITQVSGESGVGKTQLCFQLCLDVQIPTSLGGIDGEAVYVDTENTFEPRRVCEMAKSLIKHCSQQGEMFKDLSVKKFLSGIYLFRCLETVQLLAVSHQMLHFIRTHDKVKLIVVDSIAHCVRSEEDMKSRMKILNCLTENLKNLAFRHNIAVVVVNQVTTKFCGSSNKSYLAPALGATWNYVPTTKIMLTKQNSERIALLYKSPTQPRGLARYCINEDGFRDVKPSLPSVCINPATNIELSQATATDLLCNEFNEESDETSLEADVTEEGIPQKWLMLSQQQIFSCKDSNDSASGEDFAGIVNVASFSEDQKHRLFVDKEKSETILFCDKSLSSSMSSSHFVEDVTKSLVLSNSEADIETLSQTELMDSIQQDISHENDTNEPHSPVLRSRTMRKRRRKQ